MDLEAVLAEARARLADGDVLTLPDPDGTLDPRRVVLACSEAGFVLLEPERGVPPAGRFVLRKERFVVRPYRGGDEARILPMFRSRFHVERSLARWRWTYRDNPRGGPAISVALAEDGTLAAHYAGYPVVFDLPARGRELTALQIGDTMTEPRFHDVGEGANRLLGRTLRHFYACHCEGRVAFNYGFNTGKIQRFSMALAGARRFEDVPFHVLPRERFPAAGGDLRVEPITAFDGRWDGFHDAVRQPYGFLVKRDARYLQWRFADCPDIDYFAYAAFRGRRLVGWSVFRQKGDRLLWGDAMFDARRPEAIGQLLARVLAAPAHAGTRSVETWLSARPAWWRWRVSQLGFEARREPDDLAFMIVPFEDDPAADLDALLYYTMADSDLF